MPRSPGPKPRRSQLYTEAERLRRDATHWTLVQGVLAPLQFAVCLISALLILRFLLSGDGYGAATASILAKTLLLAAIMITGSIWEKVVFGRFLFAPAFFWEDVMSLLVIALHVAYVCALMTGALAARGEMALALTAYTAYAINAGQFLLKLRAARAEAPA